MEVITGKLRFQAPTGFDDITDYTFQDVHQSRKLSIAIEPLPAETPTLDSLVLDRRKQIMDCSDPKPVIDPTVQTKLGPYPALQFNFTTAADGQPIIDRMVFASIGVGNVIVLSYLTRGSRRVWDDNFNHILQSAKPGDAAPVTAAPVTAAPGFKRRSAGPVQIDVPESLEDPARYAFQTIDEKQMVVLEVADPHGAINAMPSLQALVQSEAATGFRATATVDSQVENEDTIFPVTSYRLTGIDPGDRRTWAALRSRAVLSDRLFISVMAKAPPELKDKITAAFGELMSSIKYQGIS